MKIIKINDLTFNYKDNGLTVSIFNSFNLNVEKGEFIAIKGPSGSGKSTLLYLLAGLLKFDSGSIQVKGKDISKLADLQLSLLRNKDIGFVFQQFHLLPKATVLDNILLPSLYPIEVAKDNIEYKKKAVEIATNLGIGNRLNHLPNQLSGGQQQRVAIARALINNPDIILADEPTGNLDSKSTKQIISILKELHSKGKTIILITHENDVAESASKIYFFKDGQITEEKLNSQPAQLEAKKTKSHNLQKLNPLEQFFKTIPLVLTQAFRNKARSILTMLGITVGVAAVCSMVTLGNFTKEKILESYADLGVNTILFSGFPNWQLKATDEFPTKFNFFDWKNELIPLKKIFPDIEHITPVLTSWEATVSYAGKSIEKNPKLIGISEDGLHVLGRQLIAGNGISPFHVERKSSVCVIGFEVGKRLFPNFSPIGKIIYVSQNSSSFACRVIGVLNTKTSNKEWAKPNFQVFVPFTLYQVVSEHWWNSQIKNVTIQLKKGADIEKVGHAVRLFFEKKYGQSGSFRVNSDSILIAQMQKFLNLFSILLVSIALITLTVGGMGIANMMLVSVSERLKEIGLRKALGATHTSIRNQFILESLVLCFLAGGIGIFIGIISYQGAIYGASLLIEKLEYQWVFDTTAIFLSLISIVSVGLLSGLVPALKAEKLQVIEALRSE